MNIPNFDIERELGKGGMATVYLARQVLLHRQVALKVMDPALGREQGFLDKFLDEGRIVAQLEHPNIVRVYDVGIVEDSSSVYMAMEYLPGGSLKDKLAGGKLPLDATLQILGQVGAGLGLAHEQGFIHRDIKPANILFRKDGTAVLTDFGIAKLQDSTGELTRMGYTLGTVKYMSPEQASTTKLDRRSDIYSLGLVFFEMLTGKAAVAAESTAQALHSHVALPPPTLPQEYAWLQPVLNTVLAKSPAERYPTVDAFINAVRAADPQETLLITPALAKADAAASTRPTQIVEPPAAVANHKPLWISSLAGLLLLGVVAAAAFHWFGSPLDNSKQLVPPAPPPIATADQPANQGATPFPVGGAATQREKINLVFDASGSMNQKLDGVPKIDIARSVLKTVVAGWDDNTERGLLVYGHRKRGDCDDIEQVVPVGAANQQAFIAQADHLTAMGETPIAKALLMAAEDLQYTKSKATVILVSDGKEECKGDPCAVAKQLKQDGIDFTAHVIGFAVKDQAAGKQLRCIAEATGGHYQAAQDREEFQSMLTSAQTEPATPAPKPPPATPPSPPPPAEQEPPPKPPAAPPPATTGVLKIVSISSRTGKPLPADISVYRLDAQSALPGVDVFALLGVSQAQAAERVAFRQGVTEASFTLKPGKYRVNVRSAEDRQTFDVTVNAGKTVSKSIAMQDPAPTPEPKPEPQPSPEPQQPEPQPNPEPQQPEPQPNPEPQQPEPQPPEPQPTNPEQQQPAAKPALLSLSAINKATGKAVDANFTVTQDKQQVASASGSTVRIGSLPAGEYRIAATSGRLLRGGASVTLTAGEQRKLVIPLTPIILTPPHIQLPEATQPEPEPPKPTTPIKPEVIKPEIIRPEVIKPEIIKPELIKPELLKPVTPLRPETLKPESPAPAPSAQPVPKEAAPQLDGALKQKLQGELFKRLNP
ncbi:protein kinase [Candidatus Thiothrix sp. Deng01]|uniref:Protein kinase n=1 Tax=Candidatus Thiothrix phosphatis TaxID=3112415 RepID=A0ABU6CWT7_9GAMM|nr:protein kinase [Candidatus Thiothrix sp. Deng01]MEB4591286.1 protein kinase [Candidatus Thiothrix sp. Deng01]